MGFETFALNGSIYEISTRQALWVGCAMSPMSLIALLLVSQCASASATGGRRSQALRLLAEAIRQAALTFSGQGS